MALYHHCSDLQCVPSERAEQSQYPVCVCTACLHALCCTPTYHCYSSTTPSTTLSVNGLLHHHDNNNNKVSTACASRGSVRWWWWWWLCPLRSLAGYWIHTCVCVCLVLVLVGGGVRCVVCGIVWYVLRLSCSCGRAAHTHTPHTTLQRWCW